MTDDATRDGRTTCAVVLVVRDEVDDIAGWLAWYHVLGFDACIVYDDHSTDGTWEVLQAAAAVQDVRLSRTPGVAGPGFYQRQEACYRSAIAQYKGAFAWLAFFDADEFLSFRFDRTVQAFLARFGDADQVVVNWCNYGSSHHALKPPGLPVEAYTWHGDASQEVNRHVKSFVRPEAVGSAWQNVHCFDVPLDRTLDASHRPVAWWYTPGILNRMPDWSVAKVMHYQCRSLEHFVARLRKRPDLPATMELWRSYDTNQVEDRAPLRLAPQVHAQAARYGTRPAPPAAAQPLAAPAAVPPPQAVPLRQAVIDVLWGGQDPFAGFPRNLFEPDMQGWGAAHPYLPEAIEAVRPAIVVEVGVWKGASTLAMAAKMRALGQAGVVVAVDTWLGAWDHWLDSDWFGHLGFDHGYPSLQRKFMNNVIVAGYQDAVVPLPLDSLNAAQVLKRREILPDLIHLDGAHDFDSVIADLRAWWPLLRPGGLLIGDDYYEHTHWPGVKAAFDAFFADRPSPLENASGKCRVWKRADE